MNDATLESGELAIAPTNEAARYGIRATRPDDLARVVADALANGLIVGVYEARIGRGGTLVDPRRLESRALLEREGTRGFAPAVIAESAPQLFDGGRPWTISAARPEWRELLGAVLRLEAGVHVRPVSFDDSPRLYAILQSFASVTGLPVILERSFDGDGGPTVASAEDAVRRFLATRLDMLVLDGVLFEKCAELHQPVGRSRTSMTPSDPRRARLAG